MKAELFYKSNDILGEGAMWHPSLNRFFWVDIEVCMIHEIGLYSDQAVSYNMPSRVSTIVPDKSDGIVICLKDRISHYSLETDTLTDLAMLEPHLPENRCNDGKCDPWGRLWFGTMNLNAKRGAGALYSFGAGETLKLKLPNQGIPNGIVWSSDEKKMYYIDTLDECVKEFFYDKQTGNIIFRKIAVQIPGEIGSPDGMAIDNDGMLWIAHWGGSCLGRWNPGNGKLIDKITLPVPYITSCAFGGKDGKTLFITTARYGMPQNELEQYPLSGSIFACVSHKCSGAFPNRFVS